MRSLLVALLIVFGAAAIVSCGAPTRFEDLPRAKEPVPEEFIQYFLADEPVLSSTSAAVPEVFSLQRDALTNAVRGMLVAQVNWVDAYSEFAKAAMSSDVFDMALAETAYDQASAAWVLSLQVSETAAENLDNAHRDYLANFGIQPPTSYRRVALWDQGGWIVADSGQLLHLDKTWREAGTVEDHAVKDLALVQEQGWAVGKNGLILQVTDDTTWKPTSSPSSVTLNSVMVVNSNEAWAAGDQGIILRYDGREWKVEHPADNQQAQLLDIAVDANGKGWAVGVNATVLTLRETGWGKFSLPIKLGADLSSIAMNENHMWVTGGNGIVLHYDGSQWNRVSAPITTTLNSVAALSDGKAWIAGDNGVILRCTVSECVQEASPTSFDLLDIAITEGGKSGWVVGRNNCILRYDGRHWSKIFDWDKMARAQ